MGKEPKRKCSHCGHNGHNSRTCNGKGGNCSSFRLFGVKINVPDYDFSNGDIESIRKSKSMGNLQACKPENNAVDATGYLSDGLVQSSTTKADRRKVGKPWTEHEHRCFLSGLEKLGKGDWRGISKTFVPTRTPTQVASHAQKYFLRLAASEKRKRRSSVFDIGLNGSSTSSTSPTKEAPESSSQQANTSTIPPLKLKAHANTSIFFGSSEKPPLSPIARPQGGIDFHRLPYMMGVSSNDHHHGHSTGAVSFVHVMNFPNGDFMYLPQFNGKIGTCSSSPKLMAQQGSSSMFPQTIPHRVPPQGGAAPARTTKDGVELGLGTLTL